MPIIPVFDTADRAAEDPLPDQGISLARLHGEACITCGSDEPPLHPNGVLTLPGNCDGVVRDFNTVVCTSHVRVDHEG